MKGEDEIAHRLRDVRLEVAASNDALFGIEIDQDQWPFRERCDARFDRSLELEHDLACPNALKRQCLEAHPTTLRQSKSDDGSYHTPLSTSAVLAWTAI